VTNATSSLNAGRDCRSASAACDVSVVVVSYNTQALTLQCLRSIYTETRHSSFEVMVIDNASGDGSAAAVAREFPQAVLIANRENRGFAAANNQGLKLARGRYVLLLNPDTLVLQGAIDRALAFADRRPDLAVIGCQVLENPQTVQRTCFAFQTPLNLFLAFSGLSRLFPRCRWLARPHMDWWARDSEREVDVVSGMFMLVRSSAIRQVGPMDEDYFVYGEEADWCYRFRRAGWRCCFSPVARILHVDGGNKSTDQRSLAMYVQNQKSVLLFNRKHYGYSAYCAAKAVYIGAMLVRAGAWSLQARLGRPAARHQARQAAAALRYHLLGTEPAQ
jgi:GT2 family glycosyltransferase